MMSKGNRRLESGRIARPLTSTSLFLSSFVPFFIQPAPFLVRARPLSFLSLSRTIGRTSRKWRFELADPHGKVPLRVLFRTPLVLPRRVMLYRDAPLHLRVKTSIRSCFSVGSFLRKFLVSLRLDLSTPFPPPLSFVLVALR